MTGLTDTSPRHIPLRRLDSTRAVTSSWAMDVDFPDGAALYETWFERLRAIAIERFGIAEADADRLAYEVLLSSLIGDRSKRSGPWLEAAMVLASRQCAERER